MKITLACMVLAAVVMTVYGQNCLTTLFCRTNGQTTCAQGQTEICDHLHGNKCHCVERHPEGKNCTMKADCPSCTFNRRHHCVDGHCQCSVI